jgi:hypothetical protein
MTRFLSILLAATAQLLAGYGNRVPVTIDHLQVPATQTNFPVFICANGAASTNCDSAAHTNLSIPDLKTTGNGGKVTSSSGFDIGFFSDTGCTTSLNYELVPLTYVATTGFGEWHVLIASLSSSVDTVIQMCFGNSAIVSDQSTTATWPSSYKAVWHFPNGTSLTFADSTSNARTGTMHGTIAAATAKLDGGGDTSAGGQNYMTASDTGLPAGATDRTISMWFSAPMTGGGYSWQIGNFATANQCLNLRIANGDAKVAVYDGVLNTFGSALTANTEYYVVVTFTGTTGTVYTNGVSQGTWTNASENTTLIGTFYAWESDPAVFNSNSNAKIDELRILNVANSANWISTEYTNQNTPYTFYTFGSEVGVGGVKHRVVAN